MQNTQFDFEIVINDDNSNDGTSDICVSLFNENPEKVVYFKNESNLGMIGNWLAALRRCKGKYIAVCEGDDYWTDPNKLEKQINFLEANPDYSICFHQAKSLFEDGSKIVYNSFSQDTSFDFLDLTQQNFISTASCVFRVYDHLNKMPDWVLKLSAIDWGLHLLNASKGRIFFMSDCMSVYRIHRGGVWGSLSPKEMSDKGIKIMDELNAAFNYEYDKYFEKGKAKRVASYQEQSMVKLPVQKDSLKKRIRRKLSKYLKV